MIAQSLRSVPLPMVGLIGLLLSSSGLVLAAVPPAVQGERGAVATDHPLASAAGVEILRRGGNAVDAACAAAFALGVVNPAGSGIGGGGFMLVHLAGRASPVVIDFRETAPRAAGPRMFSSASLPLHASSEGGLAVAVPGEVRGCTEAIRRFGKLPLARVLQPAIRLARRGFPLGSHLLRAIRFKERKLLARPDLARMFLPQGKLPRLGQRLKRPRLARTLEMVARRGADAFYRGWIAKDIVQAVRAAGGVLTLEDLAGYRAKDRAPLSTRYRGYDVFGMPPPSSGGVVIIGALNVLGRYKARGHNSSRYLHLMTETLKHSFADRARLLGDSDFVSVPLKRLLSAEYAADIARRIGKRTLPSKSYGSGPPKAPSKDSGTSHLSVIDAAGNAVALTTTVNTLFGSLVVGKRSGVILNNQMDDFATQPNKPNRFGLVQGERNAVAAGKRPLSSMSPTLVLKKGKVVLALGGSGGPSIITATLQVLRNVLDFRLELRDAVSRSRIHHQWLPDKLYVESDLPEDVRANLRRYGHRVARVGEGRGIATVLRFTAVQAVSRRGKRLEAASDPRKHGEAAAY